MDYETHRRMLDRNQPPPVHLVSLVSAHPPPNCRSIRLLHLQFASCRHQRENAVVRCDGFRAGGGSLEQPRLVIGWVLLLDTSQRKKGTVLDTRKPAFPCGLTSRLAGSAGSSRSWPVAAGSESQAGLPIIPAGPGSRQRT